MYCTVHLYHLLAAISFHERHLALASSLPTADTRLTSANHQLVDSYRRQAEEYGMLR